MTAPQPYFADLTSPMVAELVAGHRRPVLLLPLGAVEPHGPHAPLSTDPIISLGMCARAAARLADDPAVRVLTLPPVHYGVTCFGAGFPGGVSIRAETLHAVVTDICLSLVDQGLRYVVLVNNHFEPAHVDALRRVPDTVLAERPDGRIRYLDLLRRRNAERLTEEFVAGQCHAGRYETSLVLADHPELVDRRTMAELPRVAVSLVDGIARGHESFLAMGMDRAYCGSPAEATEQEGRSTFEVLTDLLIETVQELAHE